MVSAFNTRERLVSFSNFGAIVDVIAHGDFVDSLVIGGTSSCQLCTHFVCIDIECALILNSSC